MFIVLLKFSNNKNLASQYMAEHKAWIQRGFDQGVFLMVGSIQPGKGGCILANNTHLENLHAQVEEDPFVQKGVVSFEIMEIAPNQADDRLRFLLE